VNQTAPTRTCSMLGVTVSISEPGDAIRSLRDHLRRGVPVRTYYGAMERRAATKIFGRNAGKKAAIGTLLGVRLGEDGIRTRRTARLHAASRDFLTKN